MSDASVHNSFKFYFHFIAFFLLSLSSSSILWAQDEREQSTSANRFAQTDSNKDKWLEDQLEDTLIFIKK